LRHGTEIWTAPLAKASIEPHIGSASVHSSQGHHQERTHAEIIVGAMVSMDGVMQAPGGPTEDLTKGFKFGGWVMPYFDQEFGEERH
jgi:hypothetical protein